MLVEEEQYLWKVDDVTDGFNVFVVHRSFFEAESASWKEGPINKPGAYLLVGCSQSHGKYSAYAGKSPDAGVLTRLSQHCKSKDKSWTTAIILTKDSHSDFLQEECSFLEWELYDALKENRCITLLNKNKPSGDPRVSRSTSRQLPYLAKIVLTLADVQGLPGIDDDDIHIVSIPQKNQTSPVMKEFMQVAKKADKSMRGDYNRQSANIRIDDVHLIVHIDADDNVLEEYTSLTQAIKAIFPNCSKNAWDFWKIISTGKTARERYNELV